MTVAREEQRFPTRNYPYRRRVTPSTAPPDRLVPEANVLHRRVMGLDLEPRPMSQEELGDLEDPLGRLLRSDKPFPLTTRRVLAAFDEAGTLPDQLVFLVADGGHIPWTPETDRLQRGFRFVIVRGKGEFSLFISSSTAADSTDDNAFLQIIGWDPINEVFHFYERRLGTYFWAGMSRHALEAQTRGKGPFDSHVNGSMVMKELRAPWIHWHAPQAGINENALAPDDPLRNDALFVRRVTAERLEIEVVRPGIRRWNTARIRKAVGPDGTWHQISHFLRQAVTDTTVNLVTAEIASHLITDGTHVRLPLSFFVNRDTLFDTLGLEPDDPAVADIAISGLHYRQCIERYNVHRTDGTFRIPGDSHFAFLTPEPAFEDTQLIDAMVHAGLLTARFVAALSMTDFPNPVFSARRAALLRYVPLDAAGPNVAETFEGRVISAIRAAIMANPAGAGRTGSPELEFLANFEVPDFAAVFGERLMQYFDALKVGMSDADTVDGWFRLAEYRRRRFRRRPLAEFELTTPRTNIPVNAAALRMTTYGRVEPVTIDPPENLPDKESDNAPI